MGKLEEGTHLIVSNRFLQSVLTYHIILFFVMVFLYSYVIDFKKHFTIFDDSGKDIEPTLGLITYYVLATQTTVMSGEVLPRHRTKVGRNLLGMHIFFSWFIVVLAMTPLDE